MSNWFQRLFSPKTKEEFKEEEEKEYVKPWKICQSCKNAIVKDDKYSKQIGLYFHRKCWQKEKNAAK